MREREVKGATRKLVEAASGKRANTVAVSSNTVAVSSNNDAVLSNTVAVLTLSPPSPPFPGSLPHLFQGSN
jgi:hypothetical protein